MAANKGEGEAAPILKDDIARQVRRIGELHCDRGYVASAAVAEIIAQGGEVVCKPWTSHNTRNKRLFTKADFKINLRDMTITCPAGEVEDIELGTDVAFDADACGACPLRQQCTTAEGRHGRTVQISEDEHLQRRLRTLQGTAEGRERLRRRGGGLSSACSADLARARPLWSRTGASTAADWFGPIRRSRPVHLRRGRLSAVEVVSHHYEIGSILLTTNLAFKDWATIFPGAACVTAMIDRLTHHAEERGNKI